MRRKTKEQQYHRHVAHDDVHGAAKMGLTASYLWHHDSRHVLFTLSRYKFVAKLLEGKKEVGELGCGDAFGTRLVANTVGHVHGYDFDPVFIENAKMVNEGVKNVSFSVHDILKSPVPKRYDGLFALDVLEHIQPRLEGRFLRHCVAGLQPHGILIFVASA